MLNKALVDEAVRLLENPTPRTPERDEFICASMAAESLKLEGIDTSAEQILALVRAREKAKNPKLRPGDDPVRPAELRPLEQG